ncbi:putative immunity protein [Phycicoccus flavus]|uniref:putative immunity protein n=1 Tax=Phycicoccus flavus TaxID=2502783 RepID=UPI000FEBCEEB|nr:exonuclease SbcC [Phycicoccus flavus]NHA67721.1 exonuclease SbcC [Phycicoccus flavus]
MSDAARPISLSVHDLRLVARYAAECAAVALPLFERAHPDDERPAAAIAAARTFADGSPRSRIQRTASVDAHRAGAQSTDLAAREAARAAGHAAAAAYLHPLADPGQVRHILGSAACATRALELAAEAGTDADGEVHGREGSPDAAVVADQALADAADRASHALRDVLRRYPRVPQTGNRVALLLAALDTTLRAD